MKKHNKNVYIYERNDGINSVLVICNFKKGSVKNPSRKQLEGYKLILSNYEENDLNTLKPYEARVYIKEIK